MTRWMTKHRLAIGVIMVILSTCYGALLFILSTEMVQMIGIGYIAFMVTAAFALEVIDRGE